MRALNQKLLRDLLHLRGQAMAILLIVACGIAGLVTMMSAYDSLNLSQASYYEQYRFADVFAQLKRAPMAIAPQIQAIPGVDQVQTRIVVDVTLDIPGLDEPATGRLIAIPEQRRPMLNDLYLRRGRYIQPERRNEVLISEAFATANQLELDDRIGAVINGRWQELRIVGIALSPEYVYELRGTDILPDNRRFGVLWMGREALGQAFDLAGAFNDVALSLQPAAREAEVIFQLDQILSRYGGLGAYGRDDQVSNRFLSDEISQLQVTAAVIPSIFLGIAAFLLHMVLARIVSTQRDQIAVLKAFGYGNGAIAGHYLKLVLVIVLLGAGLGLGLGLWFGATVTQYYTHFFHFPFLRYEAGAGLLLTAVGVSTGAAVLGAMLAVQRAVKLPPAEAMRPEAPPQFRPTLIERLGLQRWLSPSGRIILRNLERKPVQAGLSMLGIAFGVAILVIGRYFEDAIDYIVQVQFRTVQREDITVVFTEPRPARARYAIAQLPGVLQAEPFRVVPVRLRHAHHSRRSGLQGLEPHGTLRHLVDQHLRPIELPSSGLVLTTKLADLLAVQPGDWLTVEVLEGNRPTRRVPVAKLVDELIGVSAYMNIDALNQLMREGQTISGAFLGVDSQQLSTLYRELKQTPAVASVSIRQTAIAQFQDTIAASLMIFTTVLVIFACIIAFGVVYNSARIAVSERGRELATLRIIGFTQTEIAVILLGEQAVITVLAIPLGSLMGYALAATMALTYDSELYRLPLVVSRGTFAFAVLVIGLAAVGSGYLIHRQLKHLDLIAVLKTRE